MKFVIPFVVESRAFGKKALLAESREIQQKFKNRLSVFGIWTNCLPPLSHFKTNELGSKLISFFASLQPWFGKIFIRKVF